MRLFALTVLLMSTLFAQTAPPKAAGSISGVVTDTNGRSVSGITVMASLDSLARTSRDRATSDSTNGSGTYSLTELPPGDYLVAVLGAIPAVSKSVRVGVDEKVRLDLVVASQPTISGRVLNQDKEPVLNASLWLIRSEYSNGLLRQDVIGPSVTGKDGLYRFDQGLEPNRRYYLFAERAPADEIVASDPSAERAPIDVSTYYPASTTFDGASAIILRPGEQRTQMDVRITTAPYYCVDGKIRLSGVPTSTLFTIFENGISAPQLPRLQGASIEQGKYQVCGLTRGLYRLVADGVALEFAVGTSDVHHLDLSMDPARVMVTLEDEVAPELPPSVTPEDLAIVRRFAARLGLPPGDDDRLFFFANGLLEANLMRGTDAETRLKELIIGKDPDLEAFRKAMSKIQMARSVRPPVRLSLGDEVVDIRPGNYKPVDKQLRPGEYFVSGTYLGANDIYIKEVTHNHNGAKVPDRVVRIAPGSTGTLKVVTGKGGGTIQATVTSSAGKPIPNAIVLLIYGRPTSPAAISRELRLTQADSSGLATFQGVAPGEYKVLATTQLLRYSVPEDLEKILLVLFQSQDVNVDAKDTVSVELHPVEF